MKNRKNQHKRHREDDILDNPLNPNARFFYSRGVKLPKYIDFYKYIEQGFITIIIVAKSC